MSRTDLSTLFLGQVENPQHPRNPLHDVYVLLRSFHARDQHLEQLEQFQATLSTNDRVLFLPDPLSKEIPSYHANVPFEVHRWLKARQEVVDIRRFRNPNGLDQDDDTHSNEKYVLDKYSVRCRNEEELERHLAELEQFSASRNPRTPLDVRRLPGFPSYFGTLRAEILEWVKEQDEVINITPDRFSCLCAVI
ncbi:hypothetical protein C8R44DRAFT_883370 [Mycena epipterygia]|nr:hypothetical protein C8R44DRAFT_883370 [Mycena epipterygia]